VAGGGYTDADGVYTGIVGADDFTQLAGIIDPGYNNSPSYSDSPGYSNSTGGIAGIHDPGYRHSIG
jgi:hypothetical protein